MVLKDTGEFKMKNKIKCNRKKELDIGRKIEMEHTSLFPKRLQKKMAIKIAEQHLDEFSCYYSKGVIPMEKKLKKLNNTKKEIGILPKGL